MLLALQKYTAVIHKMKAAFARHGIPKKVVRDNGTCYSSHKFRQFAEQWDFQHTTSSPHYPQSNGLAEKTVQAAKRILTKAREDRKDPYLSLLEYRNTPVDGLKSPAQILMSRRLRSILPTTTSQLRPQVECQRHQKHHYDKSARPLPAPHTGSSIRFQQEDGRWQPATIIQPAETPRSYHIKTNNSQTLRHNRRHLRSALDSPPEVDTQQPEISKDTEDLGNANTGTQQPRHISVSKPCHAEPNYHTRYGRTIKPRQVLDL
uniref:Integrase catalytic domain-containing protein n=1 Tax=Monopterus albus TaxID=43700 RepID=A0A3Q3K1Q2_MONAL